MSYTARITSRQPSAFMIMVDRSGSMTENISWNGITTTKSEAVASAINNMISEITSRCMGDNMPRHYFDFGVVGYSGDNVYSLLPGATGTDNWLLTPSGLLASVRCTKEVQKQRTMPDGRKVMTTVKEKVWVEAGAEYRTPMASAFTKIYSQMSLWCNSHSNSFPPIVINITDGEATDAEPEQIVELAQKLQGLSTEDGNLLLLNIHLCNSSEQNTIFPISEHELPPSRGAKLLYSISSIMPELFEREIRYTLGLTEGSSFRGMAYNASVIDLIKMLNIGSSSVNLIM